MHRALARRAAATQSGSTQRSRTAPILLIGLAILVSGDLSAAVLEAESLGVNPLPPLADDDSSYISVAISTNPEQSFNHLPRKTRDIVIVGKRVVLGPGHPNGLYETLSNSADIRTLEIHAEKVEIKESLTLPQTNVKITARDFVLNGKTISTTPLAASTVLGTDPGNDADGLGKDGAPGLTAGSLTLFVDPARVSNDPGLFNLHGGNGQNPGPGGRGQNGQDMNFYTACGDGVSPVPAEWYGKVVYITRAGPV